MVFFSIKQGVVIKSGILLIRNLDLDIIKGQSLWICGANGSGNTTLLEIIAGKERLTEGRYEFYGKSEEEIFSSVYLIRRDFSLYRSFNHTADFYQQRYFSSGIEETPTVLEFISAETGKETSLVSAAAKELGFEEMMQKRVISLSTGEERRILLLMLLLSDKKVLCFDDPWSGLDVHGKEQVMNVLTVLKNKGITIIAAGTELKPGTSFDKILTISDKIIQEGYNGKMPGSDKTTASVKQFENHVTSQGKDFSVAAEMKRINIRFAENFVLENFSWKIMKGDKWMLTGPNGSGKSTLMTLISGDNPMAYALEVVVFDRVRGSGETIWDIKEQTGYFSSELQKFFPLSLTLREAVLSGFSPYPSVRNDLMQEHYLQADELIEASGMTSYKEIPLFRLSFSQNRIALVCRALVKHPALTILDEPCQGLDDESTQTINSLVDVVCRGESKTLVYVTHRNDLIPDVINKHRDLDTNRYS